MIIEDKKNIYETKKETLLSADVYSDELDVKVLSMETRAVLLRQEIRHGRYQVFLQPKTDFKNETHGAEALVRYKNDDGRIMTPEFIPFLEKNDLIHLIDLFVFEEVCKMLERWSKENRKVIVISLNFSRRTLMITDLVKKMNELCRNYHIQREWIEIEITETQKTVSFTAEEIVIQQIHNAGYRLSLDDFGVDYSNLLYLVKYPFQVLKLDKSLIDEIEINWKNRLLLENVIQTCHKMNIQVVAEGVENKNQFEFLKEKNCDLIQGFLIDRPISIIEFEKRYLQKNREEHKIGV